MKRRDAKYLDDMISMVRGETSNVLWNSEELLHESETIKLDVRMVKNLVRFWRKEKINSPNEKDTLIALCYIDAYQTILFNHGIGMLGYEKE